MFNFYEECLIKTDTPVKVVYGKISIQLLIIGACQALLQLQDWS